MVDILRTGLSGLMAFQRALATTGHNISNANTPHYTRQRVDLVNNRPWNDGSSNSERSSFLGTGVNTAGVSRIYNDFLTQQVRNHKTSVSQLETLNDLTNQVGGLLGDAKTGLTPALQQFFSALQDVANTPDSMAARQALLSQGDSLAAQFRDTDRQLSGLRDSVNQGLQGTVDEINNLADSIANINQDILRVQGSAGEAPSDLLDQRDKLLADLSEKIAVQAVPQADGQLSVFVGTGQTLVLGSEASRLEVARSSVDPETLDIRYKGTGSDISAQLTGGQLGGYLSFRSDVLNPAQNSLGLLAIGLAETFNAQHKQGVDLNGETDKNFFQAGAPQVAANAHNTGTAKLTATIGDSTQLQPSDYEVSYDGSNYSVRRLTDDKVFNSLTVDGLTITASGTPTAGDRFLIQPTRQGAANFKVAVTDPAGIAAAKTPGNVGDNRNALALASLQSKSTLLNGSSNYQGVFAQLVAEVGTQGSHAQNTLESQQALLDQSIQARDAVSGVNLDEEAADLLRFQQAYEASAQIIKVADTLFGTLLDAIRR